MKDSKTKLFITLAITGLLIVLIFDFCDKNFSYHDILVESHGLIFDLFIFGILITYFETQKTKKDSITRYKEELSDFYGWKSEDAMCRVRGIIKRLVELNVEKINLSGCAVKNCPFPQKIHEWNFTNAKICDSIFNCADLNSSKFYLSELHQISFYSTDLTNCDFGMTILNECHFSSCTFSNTNFDYAYTTDKDWLKNIYKNSNIGIEKIVENYIISSNSITMDSIEYYQIIPVSHNIKLAKDRDSLNREMILNFQDATLNQIKKTILKNINNKF